MLGRTIAIIEDLTDRQQRRSPVTASGAHMQARESARLDVYLADEPTKDLRYIESPERRTNRAGRRRLEKELV
jgi:hypothetical protein